MRARVRGWALAMRGEVRALAACARDPRVPWIAKALAVLVVAYALSPIDLIPDMIPVLGLLDDLILIPLGVMLVVRLIPPDILDQHRREQAGPPAASFSRVGMLLVIAVWAILTLVVLAVLSSLWAGTIV